MPADQIHHSHFRDFVDAPIETVRDLYARFGLTWTAPFEAGLREALDANPRDKHGDHDYSREDLGEDPATLRRRFERYQRAFSVPDDG